MTQQEIKSDKSKSQIWFFVLSFIVILVIMLIANRKSDLKTEFMPPRSGVEKLYTLNSSLVAVSQNGEIYVWDWSNINRAAVIISPKADKSILAASGRLIWVVAGKPTYVVVSEAHTRRVIARFPAPDGHVCQSMEISANGRYVVFMFTPEGVFADGYHSSEPISIEVLTPELSSFSHIASLALDKSECTVRGLAMSDDGKMVAVAGQKKKVGWVALMETSSGKILWQQTPDASPELTKVAFSPDSAALYAGGLQKTLYAFETATGKTLHQYTIKGKAESSSAEEAARVTSITPDTQGRSLAVSLEPAAAVWVWKTADASNPQIIETPNKHIFGTAFSPDSALLATSEMRADQKLRIWRLKNDGHVK